MGQGVDWLLSYFLLWEQGRDFSSEVRVEERKLLENKI